MSCFHQYEYEGYRTYSTYIPCSAQGAYFPGDEPGTYCDITQSECDNLNGEYPDLCEGAEEIDRLCPDCIEDGIRIKLQKDGHGTIFCPECGFRE